MNKLKPLTHHAQEPFIRSLFAPSLLLSNLPARNEKLQKYNVGNFQRYYCTGKLFHAAVTIITIARTTHHAHLNTQITSRSLVRSLRHSLGQTTHREKSGPIFCSHHSHGRSSNRCTYPDAPKPIHPDKEQFCSSTLKLGTNIRFSHHGNDLFRNVANKKTETRFSP